ncbi:DUF2855 family protein [Kordiimonas sp. SCSIO 12610]|uniref:DUF2855 family protein n=1 Tax=Kordiimonas sp. SCSIO 12610 TaxID=2829597 RepID=UPI00210B3413|nr:DUF2855 family protein [Kordiimonas sp. SCSIO 12610]UTW55941.1 DUF2855 family protein [Kordiimonas sp. SCSIO 12610]
MTSYATSGLYIDRTDLFKTEQKDTNIDSTLGTDEVIMKVDHFALTANNITYAAFGDRMQYWDFFPAHDGFGSVPVWGFADVVASNSEDVKVGERFYGYYPMSSHLKVKAGKSSPAGFMDVAEHRSHLSPIYNHYVRSANDPGYSPEGEALQMLFRPLFMTSFLIDDFLFDNDFFGAKRIILSSASSKTAYGLAFLLYERDGIEVIGLTSPGNVEFTKSMNCYHQVVTYDELTSIDASEPAVFVDMAGNGELREKLHYHINDNLKYSCSVGASHWDAQAGAGDLPGAKPTLFFAPAQGQKRTKEWGPDGLQARVGGAWMKFITQASGWTNIIEHKGLDAMNDVYQIILSGKVDPKDGHILKF